MKNSEKAEIKKLKKAMKEAKKSMAKKYKAIK
jgi:hypothetical protein